jgi:hypothetical protein
MRMERAARLVRTVCLAVLAISLTTVASLPSTGRNTPWIAVVGTARAQSTDTPTDLKSTYTSKLCEVYSTGKQLVYIALGIGILIVVVLSIGSRFRTGLFVTLVASVVIVATTDKLMTFLVGENALSCAPK